MRSGAFDPGLLLAQVGAETRTRLRSPGTLVAVLVVLAGSYAWMPAPSPYAASLTWGEAGGKTITGVYNSAFVGTASALLVSTLLPFVGFYLVAGSITRDRRSGVGSILAATPLPGAAYLGGKVVAHTAYLLVVGATSIVSGLVVLFRFGEGRLEPIPFLLPWLLIVPPSLVMTAALAVLFDVTPGLRSRGGLVLWFFVWAFGLLIIPMARVELKLPGLPLYDPTGFAWFAAVLREGTGLTVSNLSIGYRSAEPMTRIVWGGLPITVFSAAARLANALWALVPLGLAALVFDRFDPSRRGGRSRSKARTTAASAELEEAVPAKAFESGSGGTGAPALALSPVETRFPPLGPYLAEARLVWDGGGLFRWALPVLALVTLAPGNAGRMGSAGFLLLLAVVISEAAARERIAGAGPLVFALPAIPRSVALWKGGALALFALALGFPMALRAGLSSFGAGFAAVSGLLFLALWAAAAGLLTGGGKLFTGTVMILWYGALNGIPPLDFCGTLSGSASVGRSALFLVLGLGALGLADLRERRRSAPGR